MQYLTFLPTRFSKMAPPFFWWQPAEMGFKHAFSNERPGLFSAWVEANKAISCIPLFALICQCHMLLITLWIGR